MLAGRRDVLYYDGNHYEVRRLSPDLQQEETLAADIVCSPIAVADGVYCAQVEGLVQVMPGAKPRRLTDGSAGGVVADLAATTHRLLWIVDAGADRLEVRSLAL
jgi:hypothetical protein